RLVPAHLFAFYQQMNLVSDVPGFALSTNPNLVNPWGIALPPNANMWVSDNGKDVSTLYRGDVMGSPFMTVPLVVKIPQGAPTGQVFNPSMTDFMVSSGTSHGPALFIFAS